MHPKSDMTDAETAHYQSDRRLTVTPELLEEVAALFEQGGMKAVQAGLGCSKGYGYKLLRRAQGKDDPNYTAGRSRVSDRPIITVRLPPELLKQLQATAEERDVSVNLLINRACQDFLRRLVPIDEVLGTS